MFARPSMVSRVRRVLMKGVYSKKPGLLAEPGRARLRSAAAGSIRLCHSSPGGSTAIRETAAAGRRKVSPPMKRAVRRSIALLVLGLSLAASAQAVSPPRRSVPEPGSFFAAAWHWIVLHALPAPKPAPRMEKAGCDIDPNGQMRCSPTASTQTEAGCEIDPDGVR